MKKKELKDTGGSAILVVLLLTVLLALMTISMVFISTTHLSTVGNIHLKEEALLAAEAGVEYAIYMLNQDPEWGLSSLNFPGDSESLPGFTHDNSAGAGLDLTSNSGFTITFSAEDPKYMSVNNLFESDPARASLTGAPCYTAKIISVGNAGHIKKILEAYLVRADYYPNAINSEGSIVLEAGKFMIRGADETTDNLDDPNSYPPGTIYSGWKPTPDPGNCSIDAYPDVPMIDLKNDGLMLAKGPIKLPAPAPTVRGTIKENYPASQYLSKLDIENILNNAETEDYGSIETINSGGVVILDSPPNPPVPYVEDEEYSSELILDDDGSGFASVIQNPIENNILKLTSDIYIRADKVQVYDDRAKDWEDLVILPSGAGPNVFRIYPAEDAYYQENIKIIRPDPPLAPPFPEPVDPNLLIPVDTGDSVRNIALDLNGHNIYAESHVMLGIPVMGKGNIITYGKGYYLLTTNIADNIIISAEDLNLDICDSVYSNHNSGLYYAGDDIAIKPVLPDTILRFNPPSDPGDPLRDCLIFPPGSKLSNTSPPLCTTGIGEYDPANADWWWMKGYKGNSIIAKQKFDGSTIEVSGYGGPMKFRLEYNGKQITITDYKITIEKTGPMTYEVNIADDDGNVMAPEGFNLTQGELNILGIQFYNTLMTEQPLEIDMKTTLVSFNEVSSEFPGNIENQTIFDTGSSQGFMLLLHNPSYMEKLLNLQREAFNVRLLTCHEIN